MSNIKIVFQRYLEFQSLQRRESMLKWCLEIGSNTKLGFYSNGGKRLSGLIPSIILSKDKLMVFRRNFKAIKRNFTETRSSFFKNNYELLIETSITDTEQFNKSNDKYQQFLQLVHSSGHNYSSDVLNKRIEFFDWCYKNKHYALCYSAITALPRHEFSGFDYRYTDQLIRVLDQYGTIGNLFDLFKHFERKSTSKYIMALTHMKDDKIISRLIELQTLVSASVRKPTLFNENRITNARIVELLEELNALNQEAKHKGLTVIITKLISELMRIITDPKQKCHFIDKIYISYGNTMQLEDFDCQFVAYIYYYQKTENLESNFTTLKALTQHMPEDKRTSVLYCAFAMNATDTNTLNTAYSWYNIYKDRKLVLDYNNTPNEIWLAKRFLLESELPEGFVDSMGLDKSQAARFISMLIYAHTRWGDKEQAIKLFNLKSQLNIPIHPEDHIGLIRSQVHLRKNQEALETLKGHFGLDIDLRKAYINSQSYDTIFKVFTYTNNWERLKELLDTIINNGDIITHSHYQTIFKYLGTTKDVDRITDLWETFTKKGHKPNANIICAIISGHINTKSYSEALQWFSAFSFYDVPLSSDAYGLMLNALSGSNDTVSCFRLLDELAKTPDVTLIKSNLHPLIENFALSGDYQSVEIVLNEYFPKFDIPKSASDDIWILKAHQHGQRHGTVVAMVGKLRSKDLDTYKDNAIALKSSTEFKTLTDFRTIWKRINMKFADELNLDAATSFMIAYVRKIRSQKEVSLQLDKLTKKFGKLPSRFYDAVIFHAIRWHHQSLVWFLLGEALLRGAQPSARTYSYVLYSNTRNLKRSKQNIYQNLAILDEVLVKRKERNLGKLDWDLNAQSFNKVIKEIIRIRGVTEARKYFELYVELSKNNLLGNIYVLNSELMILGAENRWNEFENSFNRYLTMIKIKMDNSRSKNSKQIPNRLPGSRLFGRTDSDAYVDEIKTKFSTKESAKIQLNLKESLASLWSYRLRQLSETERLSEVVGMIEQHKKDGLILSSSNINLTAYTLSKHPHLLKLCVSFIDGYMLSSLLTERSLRLAEIRHKVRLSSYTQRPEVFINRSMLHGTLCNVRKSLTLHFGEFESRRLIASINASPAFTILKNISRYLSKYYIVKSSRDIVRKRAFEKIDERRGQVSTFKSIDHQKRLAAQKAQLNGINYYSTKDRILKELGAIHNTLPNVKEAEEQERLITQREKLREEMSELKKKWKEIVYTIDHSVYMNHRKIQMYKNKYHAEKSEKKTFQFSIEGQAVDGVEGQVIDGVDK